MYRIYNDILPLDDNFEVANQVTMFGRVLKVGQFIKDNLKMLSFAYKIYSFIKNVLYYFYLFLTGIFFAVCCYFLILIIGYLARGFLNLMGFAYEYIKNKKINHEVVLANSNPTESFRTITSGDYQREAPNTHAATKGSIFKIRF
jgi:hypothetical protein